MTDSKATDVATFHFMGYCVCHFVVGSTDYQMNLFLVNTVDK